MANTTVNYGLKKPQEEDFYNVGVFNDNADIIDTTLKAHAEPTFEDYTGGAAVPDTETALATIKSKATLGTLFGNIKALLKRVVAEKVDKETGKGLSEENYSTTEKTKLAGIASGANNYTHPDSHPAALIVGDATHRFVTDAEKTTWSGKADAGLVVTKSQVVNNLLATAPGNVLDATQGKALNDKITTINSDLMVEDISSKITAINGTEIIALTAKRVQSLCFVSFTIKVPADSVHNLSVISLDTSIRPIADTETVMINAVTGKAYAAATNRNFCVIRFSAVGANLSYDYRSEIKGQIIWFI